MSEEYMLLQYTITHGILMSFDKYHGGCLLVEVSDVRELVSRVGLTYLMDECIENLREAFKNWKRFRIVKRTSFYYPFGVVEIMPVCSKEYCAIKIVNGHPSNPERGLLSVVATGMLIDVPTGYPLMISEATLLTAIRTAATTALATDYLSRKDSINLGIIGTGAQSEFLCLAINRVRSIDRILAYDIDRRALEKFRKNLKRMDFNVERCSSSKEVAQGSDILTTATTCRGRAVLADWIPEGVHINAIGGDAPGKTELDPAILKRAKIVVEYKEQALVEGEVQNVGEECIYAELWEVVAGLKKGRESREEVTVFDSVGFALEDLVILKMVYKLVKKLNLGREVNLIPGLADPKNLIELLL